MGIQRLIPYIRCISGDLETPVTLYSKYVGEGKGFLLESAEMPKGRYSFLGKNPFLTIRSKDEKVVVEQRGKLSVFDGRALDVAREYIGKYHVTNNSDIPFVGGAVGTIGYDIIRQYEELPRTNEDTLGLPDVNLLFVRELIAFDHKFQQINIVVLESDDKQGKETAEKKLEAIEKLLHENATLENINSVDTHHGEPQSNVSKEQFCDMVNKAKKYIYEGDIFQVVLSQRWSIECHAHPFTLYRKLRQINPSAYLFYFNLGDYQVAGSSPEMLVGVRGKTVTTCPIAGTRKRGKDVSEDQALAKDLLADPKEQAEHVMLVDLGRNDMGRVAKIGTVTVPTMMDVRNYSHVMHLVSLVEGEKREEIDSFDVLSTFLPAGTLSGAPKIRAMEIIEELEPSMRGMYGGAIGYFGFDGDMDMCIAIRTMLIHEGMVYMQAGAGIVADSIAESEYEETQNKVQALMQVLRK
ncbi:MAG: anthranilate synthase component I [Eubacteriales bacterium]